MIFLVLVTIWIFRLYKNLALLKGYKGEEKRWGWRGASLYLGVSLGLEVIVNILIMMDLIQIDLKQFTNVVALGLVSYGTGGLATYIGYRKLELNKDKKDDINSFR